MNIEEGDNIQGIDFIDIINTIRQRKRLIYKALIIFSIIGLLVAVFTPNEYKSSTVFVPQGSDSKKVGGNLGGLAALAGVNIGSGASESGIPLSLYSEIINSIPFQRELLKTPITVSERKEKVTYSFQFILNSLIRYRQSVRDKLEELVRICIIKPDVALASGCTLQC